MLWSFVSLLLIIIFKQIETTTTTTSTQNFPPNYPHYYNWSIDTNSFEIGHLLLPADARSVQPNFLTTPPTEKFRSASASASNQDIIILTIFHDMNDGYFIDLAANEWKKGSNTYILEYYNNWKGICIEANPHYHLPLLSNRKCSLFINPVSDRNGDTITFRLKEGFSGIVGTEFDNHQDTKMATQDLELKTITLTTILDFMKAPSTIHYLSLDIEGAEYYAMKGFNFKKYILFTLTIERPKAKLHALLIKHGYLLVVQLTDYGECLYVHHSLPNLEKTWKDYYKAVGKGEWFNEPHEYLNEVKWNWNLTEYLQNAEVAFQKHHGPINPQF